MAKVSVKWNSGPVERSVEARQEAAARDIGAFLLDEANKTVPLEEATLERSGFYETDGSMVVVAYDTPYAVTQHEMLDWVHPGGRRAKWLELTFKEQAKKAADYYADRMKGAF